jgi:putative protease
MDEGPFMNTPAIPQPDPAVETPARPVVLAPAGSKASFLAALAAGADAVYCGLKQLSARMEARNFTLDELAALADLARRKGTRVFVTLNSLIKPDEIELAGALLVELNRRVGPEALIIQDPALIELAGQTGYKGELHLSTLTQVSFPAALALIKRVRGVTRVVLPRELNVDEIRQMAEACPKGLGLEVFVHGALCYGVSGRCYWSSMLGGKSGLRGRCVQPCRRLYRQGEGERRFFSCLDLSLDVLVRLLLTIPAVKGWKIEGRKKGPHYVYHTVLAYKILRDHPSDGQAKKEAIRLLKRALGREGTRYGFLPQRPIHPIPADGQTASGMLLGKLTGTKSHPYLKVREGLFEGDVLRLGYEDETWHMTQRITRPFPPGSRLYFPPHPEKKSLLDLPVFLIDRRDPELKKKMDALEREMEKPKEKNPPPSLFRAKLPAPFRIKTSPVEQKVYRRLPAHLTGKEETGVWLTEENHRGGTSAGKLWWWLPPVLWPGDEERQRSLVEGLIKKGCRRFVLNAPWQAAFFPYPERLELWAGPFCNISNALAVSWIKSLGFSGVVAGPELGEKDYLSLPRNSPLPLGMVLSGYWPLSLSRILAEGLKTRIPFQSPKGETAWAVEREGLYWIYPNWRLDLTPYRSVLQRAGYRRFIHFLEPLPPKVPQKERPGLWNWKVGLF